LQLSFIWEEIAGGVEQAQAVLSHAEDAQPDTFQGGCNCRTPVAKCRCGRRERLCATCGGTTQRWPI